MSFGLWWEQYPDRLRHELDALAKAGISYTRDENALAAGIMRLELHIDVSGQRIPLVVTFPDLYPYFRFQVDAPTLSLAHHQNPFSKNLCLIGRGTHHWRTVDTVARLLLEQLETVLVTGASTDHEAVRGREQEQAEPSSDYYPCPDSAVIIPSDAIPEAHTSGTFTVATIGGPNQAKPLLRGAIARISGADGSLLAHGDSRLLSAFSGDEIEGWWCRVPDPIPYVSQDEFLKEILTRFPTARNAPVSRFGDGWLQVWGVLFPEESGWRNGGGDGWIFVCLFNEKRSKMVAVEKRSDQRSGNQKIKRSHDRKRR